MIQVGKMSGEREERCEDRNIRGSLLGEQILDEYFAGGSIIVSLCCEL